MKEYALSEIRDYKANCLYIVV